MEDIDDDFGELYADVEFQVSSAINGIKSFDESHLIKNDLGFNGDEKKEENSVSETGKNGSDSDDDDDDDDFDVVVNDDDFDAKNGGGDGWVCRDVREDDGQDVGNLIGNNRIRVENGQTELNGGSYGGERSNLGKNNCKLQYKYVRRYGPVYTGSQKSISLGGDDREDDRYIQHRRSNLGQVGPSYGGYAPSSAEHGNGFWLPWYRTILDVDIDTFEQKPWTLPGADISDYFNFGFDEESWKCYCQSVDELRRHTLAQNRSQRTENTRTKLEHEAAAREELNGHETITSHVSEFSSRQFKGQIGRPIHVEDSNAERQPSMGARAPRYRDSDVVIEITVQDSGRSSSLGEETSNEVIKTECKISEDGYGFENVEPKAEKNADSKHFEMAMESLEENIHSPSASSELKRSYESATVSSHMLQASSSQGKTQNSESDTLQSGEAGIVSKEDTRAVQSLNTFMKDADRNSTGTNPCVADIDLLYGDNIQSSPTPSDSDEWYKASDVGDHRDFRRTEVGRRSSSDSIMKGHPVVEDGHYVSRQSRRDALRIKSTGGKYRSRARSPIEEDWKHVRRRVRKHPELNSYSDEDDNYHIKFEGHLCGRKQLSAHHRRIIERPHTTSFDDEDWASYGEKKSSRGYCDKMFVEKQFQGACMRELHLQDHWKSKDERSFHFQREWDEEEFFWERRTRRTKGGIVEGEWYLHEKECMIRDGKLKYQMKPLSSLKYSSLVDRERWNSRRDYDDFPFSKRSKRHPSLEGSYPDGPALDRYARSYPLNDWEKENLNSDYEYERRLRYFEKEVATSGRVDQYLENPSLDLDYPWCNRIDDEYSYWLSSPNDYHDRHPSYDERRRDFTIERYDVDDSRVFQKYGRRDRYISDRWQFCDRKDAYARQEIVRHPEDEYFGKIQTIARSKGMNCIEESPSSKCLIDSYGENMLDSFKGVARHKLHGTTCGFVPGGMSMHTQNMKQKVRLVKGGGGKSCDASSTMPTRVEHKHSGLWCRNSVEACHDVRERKSAGKCSKARSDTERDASLTADGSVQKHQKWEQQVKDPVTKVVENKVCNVQSLQKDKITIQKQEDASDLEEGQILTEEPGSEIRDGKKVGQVSRNESRAYDENRILETMAKMEKRRERFKEPILLKKETGSETSDPKPADTLAETAEPKQQRPARKRRWGGN